MFKGCTLADANGVQRAATALRAGSHLQQHGLPASLAQRALEPGRAGRFAIDEEEGGIGLQHEGALKCFLEDVDSADSWVLADPAARVMGHGDARVRHPTCARVAAQLQTARQLPKTWELARLILKARSG
jgi:hypothetical protein